MTEKLFKISPPIDELQGTHSVPVFAMKSLCFDHPDVLHLVSILAPLAVIWLLSTLLKWCADKIRMPAKVESAFNMIDSKVKFNFIIRYLMQTYLSILITLFLVSDNYRLNFDDGFPLKALLWTLLAILVVAIPLTGFLSMLNQQIAITRTNHKLENQL